MSAAQRVTIKIWLEDLQRLLELAEAACMEIATQRDRELLERVEALLRERS